jgi:enoyl-CoA hydratase/carnithine racemase
MSDDVLIEPRGPVLWLTINRESKRNALGPGVIEGLSQGLARAEADASVRAVVLTGAGEKAFCAGGDLQSASPFSVEAGRPYGSTGQLFRLARQSTVPLIARVNGACLAGGMGLLAMCDLALAAPTATFGLPEVKVGMFPAQVLSVLQQLLPRRRLNELCLLGDNITADEAQQIGLLNEVAADLDGALQALLDRLLARSPTALRRGLYMMKKMETMSFEEAIGFGESQVPLLAMSADAKEGIAAFAEKRKPVWPSANGDPR